MIFYTSDLHFGHQNVIRFDNRPFDTVSEMDYTLIRLWNSRVREEDSVYCGGFCIQERKAGGMVSAAASGKKAFDCGQP